MSYSSLFSYCIGKLRVVPISIDIHVISVGLNPDLHWHEQLSAFRPKRVGNFSLAKLLKNTLSNILNQIHQYCRHSMQRYGPQASGFSLFLRDSKMVVWITSTAKYCPCERFLQEGKCLLLISSLLLVCPLNQSRSYPIACRVVIPTNSTNQHSIH